MEIHAALTQMLNHYLNCSADHKKLPFMAMLRNLRNLIKAGISDRHHNMVIRRLTDQVSTIYFLLKNMAYS